MSMQQRTLQKGSGTQDSLVIRAGGYSTKGAKAENQDAFALKINRGPELELKGHVAVIADGVSSANDAAKASQLSVCHFIEEYLATPESWSVNKAASQVISSLNRWLYSQQLTSDSQWFSTFSALVLKGNRAHIFHIGDCQVVKINHDGYQILTREHSSPSGMLNRAIGADVSVEVDLCTTSLELDDVLMMSCDGVHQFVKPQQVRELIKQHHDLEVASQAIADLAKAQGSLDNLTCLLIEIKRLPAQAFEQLVFANQQRVIPPPLRVGAKLEQYEIIDPLSETTRSHVYLAKDTVNDCLVVLKVPSVNLVDEQQVLNDFVKEGWIGNQINHPAVMKIYPQPVTSQFVYHVCEYIEGQTLATWLHDHPKPSLAKVRDILSQLVKALRILQRYDVIHCDIKADNFMIEPNGRIKLIDFGSCEIGSLASTVVAEAPKGTLNFTAPELFLGQANNHQSDLFSLGVLVYQMLSNRLPYKELSMPSQAPKQYHLSEFIAGINFPTEQVLIKPQQLPLIERDPVRFWQGISAILLGVVIVLLMV
ncbi:MAG: bifunctional protein-serine/threonine kinase/phosphatase [Gammaproteobacteria bacterium]|nr:bifunctional protein-serine/threonine kinase/phosphatase [Gammaproteobacteria bacterium]